MNMPATTRKQNPPKSDETPAVETTPAAETTPAPAAPANFFDAKTLAAIKAAPAWMPLDGDTITGELIAAVKRNAKDVGDYPCVIIRPNAENGEAGTKFVAIHAYHDDVPADLRSVGAKRGDQVTFVYASKRSAKRLGKDNATYSVVPANGGELDVYEL
jgi:hypothetical protein